jgi:putative copper export protein
MLLIVARALNLYCAGLALGIPAGLALVVLPPLRGREAAASEGVAIALRRAIGILWAMISVVLVTGVAWLLLEGAAMSGRGLAAALSPAIVGKVLWRTHFGLILLIRLILLLALGAGLLLVPRMPPGRGRFAALTATSAFAAGGYVAVAWSGHAAATSDVFQVAADAMHLLGAGLWLGGLVALVVLFGTTVRTVNHGWIDFLAAVTHRFFWLGIACVGVLIATGFVNTWYLVGSVPALIGTEYGHLLLPKIAFFGMMLALAAVNQFHLAPHFDRSVARRTPHAAAPTLRALRRNATIEAVLGFFVIAVVSGLGTVPPGAHSQPWWPFPWRFSLEAMALPAVSNEIWLATAAVAIGCAICVIALLRRRRRFWLLASGLVLIAFAAPSFHLLTVSAYPTSFVASPVAYTSASIARGAALYPANCAACHGRRGKGDGEAARTLEVPPADLTAAHVLDHSEGDIFWWLSSGIPESGMPGFAGVLSDDRRWDLVNFVRTLPVGGLDDGLTPTLAEATAPRAPDFPFRRPDGAEETLLGRAAASPLLLVFFTPSEETAEDSRLHRLADSRGALVQGGLDLLALPLTDGPAASTPLAGGAANPDLAEIVVTAGPDVAATYRLIATSRSRAASTPSHLEFLVDGDGYLRALWTPAREAAAEPPGWDDLRNLVRLVGELNAHPIAAAEAPAHVHVHTE